MNTSTENTESSSSSDISSSEEKIVRKRGRPRKFENNPRHHQKFNNVMYEAPIGFNYVHPQNNRILCVNPLLQRGFYNTYNQYPGYPMSHPNFHPGMNMNYHNNLYSHHMFIQPSPRIQHPHVQRFKKKEERTVYIPEKRQKRAASVQERTKIENNEDSYDEEVEEWEEEDNIEKLLGYNEEDDTYYVKFRYMSYLHCDYVKREDIIKSKSGAIKVKRFRPSAQPFDPDFIKVDRVLHEDHKEGKVFIIKWKKLPYELSTEEKAEDVTKCEFFDDELKRYRDRKKIRVMRHTLEWRPSREIQVKFEESPIYKDGNKLRAYQLEGLNWLLNRWYFRVSCIMADEMGLGKTVQSVVFVNSLFTKFDYVGPILIVAPLSTIVHWEREFKSWTDLRILTYHGTKEGREIISTYEFFLKTNNLNIRLFDVLITTYEMVMAGIDHISQFNWAAGIFDEAHRLKNANSKAATTLRSINFSHKVLLSGTPLQNNITELWSLLNFINPQEFGNSTAFIEEYKLENSADVEKIQGLLRPLMLRRMKEDVEKTIPMKEETIVEVELTMIQKRFYRAILEKNMEFLTKGCKDAAPNLLNAMMELRKCCIHPYLIKGAEEKIIGDYIKRKRKESVESPVVEQEDVSIVKNVETSLDSQVTTQDKYKPIVTSGIINDIEEYYKIFIQSSGKLVLLDKLLNKLHGKHKVLIFSQMTRCLDLLAEYLAYKKYKYERIDGGVRGENRQAAIDRFSDANSDVFVFLLCTRAGGVGINLTAADTVIIFDSDWNPQNDLQAQARCHRIGQTNEVKIYRLVTRNTYEREMFDKAGMKLGLDRAVLQRMSFEGQKNEKVKKKDAIEILLRKGAYGVLMETDEACKKFCDEDIDQILERRTKVVRHSDGGNVFSKASFQVDEEIDDPDFWDNLLSKKKNEENEGRVKRQMRRLARDDTLSQEELFEIDSYLNIRVENENDVDFYENQCLLIFLLGLKYGVTSLGLGFEGSSLVEQEELNKYNLKEPLLYLKYIVKFSMDNLQNSKIRSDFSYCMEQLLEENYDPSLFEKYKSLYNKYGEKFLLRIQVVLLLKHLLMTEELNVEKSRGWNQEDDNKLIYSLFNYGYGNYVEKIRNKSPEESNQRIRKVISTLNRIKEMAEADNLHYKAIMKFGKITDNNEDNIIKFLEDKDINKLRETIARIINGTKRSRTQSEAECYERIIFFEKLSELSVIQNVRKVNMPRNWTREKDVELKDYLLEKGFVSIQEVFNISEDLAFKRCESLIKSYFSQKSTEE